MQCCKPSTHGCTTSTHERPWPPRPAAVFLQLPGWQCLCLTSAALRARTTSCAGASSVGTDFDPLTGMDAATCPADRAAAPAALMSSCRRTACAARCCTERCAAARSALLPATAAAELAHPANWQQLSSTALAAALAGCNGRLAASADLAAGQGSWAATRAAGSLAAFAVRSRSMCSRTAVTRRSSAMRCARVFAAATACGCHCLQLTTPEMQVKAVTALIPGVVSNLMFDSAV